MGCLKLDFSYYQKATFKLTKGGLHKDYLGSVLAISDEEANILEQRSFDAWGGLDKLVTQNGIFETQQAIVEEILANGLILDRGYTGHEHLWAVDIIHMNGRLYDPALKRFLSPDNFIQDPFNTQNFNRYGYVLNNPLLYTDPSGEVFLGPLFFILTSKAFIVGAAIAISTTMLSNAIAGNPLHWGIGKAAVIGGLSGFVSAGIGTWADGLGAGKFLFQAGAHGVSGGVFAELGGGDFGSGFLSGMVSSFISSGIKGLGIKAGIGGKELNGFGESSYFDAAMIASGGLSGGISASIAGGDFWDGARQGLIVAGLNHVAHAGLRNNTNPDPPCKMPDGSPCLYIYPKKNTTVKSFADYARTGATTSLGLSRNLQEATAFIRLKEAVYGTKNHIQSSLVKFSKGPFEFRTYMNDKTIKNLGSITKFSSSGLGLASATLSVIDMNQNGVNTSNSLDLIMTGVSFMGAPGAMIGGAYFMGNLGSNLFTGQSIGQHFDNYVNQ